MLRLLDGKDRNKIKWGKHDWNKIKNQFNLWINQAVVLMDSKTITNITANLVSTAIYTYWNGLWTLTISRILNTTWRQMVWYFKHDLNRHRRYTGYYLYNINMIKLIISIDEFSIAMIFLKPDAEEINQNYFVVFLNDIRGSVYRDKGS